MTRNFVRNWVAAVSLCLSVGCGGDDANGGSTGINTNNATTVSDGGGPACPGGQHQACFELQHHAPSLVCECVPD